MSFYNTGNPVPSIDPRDLDDNAKHIDELTNSTFPTFVDRLGTTRRTLAGIEADADAIVLRDELADSSDTAEGFSLVGTLQFGLSKPLESSPVEKGFWNDIGSGANIWKARDRFLVGDAVDQDGNKTPTVRTWVGVSANGYMTYFDSRSQMSSFSSIGAVGAAFASRSSDNVLTGELNTIGAATFVDNNNTNASDKKSCYGFYAHAVQTEANQFTTCMEVDIANRQATVNATPYSMGTVGTTAAHWIGTGGETSQSGLSVNPASVAVGIISSGTRNATAGTGALFNKGIVFQADALSGCDGTTGTATAIEMARGHRVNWLTPTNGYAAHIRSDNATTANATSMVFVNAGVVFKGLKPDLVTEQNLLAVNAVPAAVNYFQIEPAATGVPVVLRATGTDTNIDLGLFTKGTGVIRLGYTVTTATTPANFTAQQTLAFKDGTGTTYYIPCRAATW